MAIGTGARSAAAVLGSICLALGAATALAQPPATAPPTAEQILARVAATYAACRSYSDTGVVTDRYPGILGHTTEKPFRTAFVRPDRFRFQFVDTSFLGERRIYIVWRRGGDIRTWWDVRPGIAKTASLADALGGATGVSGGSAHTVPALLLPNEVGGRCATDLARPRLVGEASVGATRCLRVAGMYGPSPATLWIDAARLVILRFDRATEIPEGTVEETTTYAPVLDGEVTDAMLAFDPPSGE